MALSNWMEDIYKIRDFLVPPITGSGKKAYSADASSTPLDVTDAPAAGKVVVVDFLLIGLSTTAAVVSLYEESNATALFSMPIGQNSFLKIPKEAIFKLLTAGKKLQLKTSTAAPVYTYCASHGE